MAIIASKGPVEVASLVVVGREARSVVEAPRRSPADVPLPDEVDWTWEAE